MSIFGNITDAIFGGGDSGGSRSTVPNYLLEYGEGAVNLGTQFLFPGAGGGVGNINDVRPYVAFPGQRVAPLSGLERLGMSRAGGMVGSYANEISDAFDHYRMAGEVATNPMASELIERGTTFNNERIEDYVNPYASGVVDELYRLAEERLTEDLLPNVNDVFTGAGMFGSTRHAEFTNRALRDTQRETLGQARQVLSGAYDNALQAYGQERARDLTGAEIALRQGQQEAGINLGVGDALLSGAGQGQALDINDINTLFAAGGLQRGVEQDQNDFNYSQFIEGRDWPLIQLSQVNQALGGGPYSFNYPTLTNPQQGPSAIQQLAGLGIAGIGAQRAGLFN